MQDEAVSPGYNAVEEGVFSCGNGRTSYPLQDCFRELLPNEFAYRRDRARFFKKPQAALEYLGLTKSPFRSTHSDLGARLKQQSHFIEQGWSVFRF